MSAVWPVVGPLVEPANRSGVHGGPHARCGCRPSYGEDCPKCDGSDAERFWRPSHDNGQTLPPCMRPTNERRGGEAA